MMLYNKFTKVNFDKIWKKHMKRYVDVPGYFNNGKGFLIFYSPELWNKLWNETLKQISNDKV